MSLQPESAVHAVEPEGTRQTDEDLHLAEMECMLNRVRSVYPLMEWESVNDDNEPARVGLVVMVARSESRQEGGVVIGAARYFVRASIMPELDGDWNLTGLWKLSMMARIAGHAPGVPRVACVARVAFRWGSLDGPEGLVELMDEGVETMLETLQPSARCLRLSHKWRRDLHSPFQPGGPLLPEDRS